MSFSSPTNTTPNVPDIIFADVLPIPLDAPYTIDILYDVPHIPNISFDAPPISDTFSISDVNYSSSSTPIIDPSPIPGATPLFVASSSHDEIVVPIADIHSEPLFCIALDRGK